MDNRLLNIHEAAAYLGRKHQAVRRLVAEGILPAYKDGSSYIFTESDLERVKTEKYPEGMTHSDIAREYKVHRTTIAEQFKRLKVEPVGWHKGRNHANVYSHASVAKFAQILGWDHRHKNQTDE